MLTADPAAARSTITLTCPRPGLALVTVGGGLDLVAVERLRAVLTSALTRPEVVDLVAWCALGEELPTEAMRARCRQSGEDQLGDLASAGARPW